MYRKFSIFFTQHCQNLFSLINLSNYFSPHNVISSPYTFRHLKDHCNVKYNVTCSPGKIYLVDLLCDFVKK